jgi:hypothetical protein
MCVQNLEHIRLIILTAEGEDNAAVMQVQDFALERLVARTGVRRPELNSLQAIFADHATP